MTSNSGANSSPQRTTKRTCKHPVVAVLGGAAIVIGIATLITSERRHGMERSFRRNENTVEGRVTIERPVEKVFEFYHDFKNLPTFLGDVMRIDEIGPATSRWTIQGPLGIQVQWIVRVTEERPNELIRYETMSSPALKTRWEIYFSPGSTADETNVREVMRMPLGRVGRAALALMGKFPDEEETSNLHRLKEVLETGRVTDTSYAVKGKFDQRLNNNNKRNPKSR